MSPPHTPVAVRKAQLLLKMDLTVAVRLDSDMIIVDNLRDRISNFSFDEAKISRSIGQFMIKFYPSYIVQCVPIMDLSTFWETE